MEKTKSNDYAIVYDKDDVINGFRLSVDGQNIYLSKCM